MVRVTPSPRGSPHSSLCLWRLTRSCCGVLWICPNWEIAMRAFRVEAMITPRYIQIAAAITAGMWAIGCSPGAITPQSSMFTGPSGGCGDFVVYRFNGDATLAVSVRVNEEAIPFIGRPVSLDITSEPENVAVEVLQFRAPALDYFCDDVGGDPPIIANWAAVSGAVVVENNPGIPPQEVSSATHKVSVVLKNIRLKNAKSGEIVELHELEIRNVWVGWLAG